MRIAIVSDAHANSVATKSALHEIQRRQADLILFAGDAIGYYADVNETCSLLREANVIAVKGNHDAFLTGELLPDSQKRELYAIDYTLQQISEDNLSWLKSLPQFLHLELSGHQFMICHGSPWNYLSEYVYPDYSDFERFSSLNADIVVLGHTHRPMIKKTGGLIIVNPGSCGQPRDNDSRGSFALIDTETMEISIERVAYDIDSVINRCRACGIDDSMCRILSRHKNMQ